MFDAMLEVNGDKLRLIFPHKCGSSAFGTLINNGFFNVKLLRIDDVCDRETEVFAYSRNPYHRIISCFFQYKLFFFNKENANDSVKNQKIYIETDDRYKIDEFRSYIISVDDTYQQYGSWFVRGTDEYQERINSHIQPSVNDIFNALQLADYHLPGRGHNQNIIRNEELENRKVNFCKLEEIRNNFVLAEYWKEDISKALKQHNNILFSPSPFTTWKEYLDGYNRAQYHKYYNSTTYLYNSKIQDFYDEETIRCVNRIYEDDFKYFDYDVVNHVEDIHNV
jgi:hypothetical protein